MAQTCSVSSLRGDGERKRSVRGAAYDAAVGGDQGEASRTGCVAGSGQRWWCRQREKLLVLNTGGVGRAVSCTVAQIVAANVSATAASSTACDRLHRNLEFRNPVVIPRDCWPDVPGQHVSRDDVKPESDQVIHA